MWEQFKVRCSAIAEVRSNSKDNPVLTKIQKARMDELYAKPTLTENQKKELAELELKNQNKDKLILSDTCVDYLMDAYSYETTKKLSVTKELDIMYTAKGKMVEEDSILLLSRLDKVLYTKNDIRVENDFLTGEPDIYEGDHIKSAKKVIDIKSVWDYPGFLKKINQKPNNGYDWQLKGYMDLTGATTAEVAYCLVNTPETIVNDFRRRLFYKMNVATEENPEYLMQVAKLEHSMYFDDIEMHKRVYRIPVNPMTDDERTELYDRVKKCRLWLAQFHEKYEMLNK